MSRYLVTGGAGRLGRSVVRGLADAGHDVVSVDRQQIEGLPVEQRVVDLLDAEAARACIADVAPDAIVHLAGIAVPFSAPEPEIFQVNTALALTVVHAAEELGVRAVLLASSPTVIGYGAPVGWTPRALPLDEEHPLEPWHAYSVAKVAIETYVASRVRAGTRLRLGVFRPCYVIAPEEWGGAPTQQGHTVSERLDDPEMAAVALFNYVDARDAADFVRSWLAAPDAAPNGSVFFVGAADSLVREPVGEALARLLPDTAPLAERLAPTDPVFSSALAERLLGWKARRSWRTELARRPEEAR